MQTLPLVTHILGGTKMKRSVFLFTCIFIIIFSIISKPAMAKINQTQLEQYLVENNWTMGELVEYLNFYDYRLNDFATLEELSIFLGTPITSENLNDLLVNYQISHNELVTLLAEFGETMADYKFIEDLDYDVQFYLAHNEDFSIFTDFLSLVDLTEDELKNFFEYVSTLDENIVQQKLTLINEKVAAMSYLQGEAKLSIQEEQQLFSLWNDMLKTLSIDPRFYLVKDDKMTLIDVNNLTTQELFADSQLFIALHNLEGELLGTLKFHEDMLNSHLIYESLQQLGEIVGLAGEYREMIANAKLPQTAGNYVRNMLISFIMIIFLIVKYMLSFKAHRPSEGTNVTY